eukprot:831890-Prorocentrum_lima.AAC.1
MAGTDSTNWQMHGMTLMVCVKGTWLTVATFHPTKWSLSGLMRVDFCAIGKHGGAFLFRAGLGRPCTGWAL